MDIVSKKDELLYEMEQFELYLKTPNGIPGTKKSEYAERYVRTMNELLNAHGIDAKIGSLPELTRFISNLK